MNKTYSVKYGNTVIEFQAPTPRASLNMAMKYAERCQKQQKSVTVFCGGDIVWVSQRPSTIAV